MKNHKPGARRLLLRLLFEAFILLFILMNSHGEMYIYIRKMKG